MWKQQILEKFLISWLDMLIVEYWISSTNRIHNFQIILTKLILLFPSFSAAPMSFSDKIFHFLSNQTKSISPEYSHTILLSFLHHQNYTEKMFTDHP